MRKPRRSPNPTRRLSPAECLREAERLFLDFRELTPFKFRPFIRSFSSFREYERWRHAQTNAWYR
jgi:hypothetical protein